MLTKKLMDMCGVHYTYNLKSAHGAFSGQFVQYVSKYVPTG